jgi:hypothetical protein
LPPNLIDGSVDVEQLSPNGCVTCERNSLEVFLQIREAAVTGSHREVRFELLVSCRIDANTRMPLGHRSATGSDACSSVADGVSLEANRVSAAIVDLFLRLEWMVAFRHQLLPPKLFAAYLLELIESTRRGVCNWLSNVKGPARAGPF